MLDEFSGLIHDFFFVGRALILFFRPERAYYCYPNTYRRSSGPHFLPKYRPAFEFVLPDQAMPIMQLTAHTIALIMAALPASIMAWDCDKEQHQNVCPDYSIGPACFGTMSWGHCDRGCAESVHVADGTWCSGTGVILALGVPISTPGSQNHPAPPPVPYQPGAQPGAAPTSGTPTPGSQNPASSPVSSQPGAAPNPSVGQFLTFLSPLRLPHMFLTT